MSQSSDEPRRTDGPPLQLVSFVLGDMLLGIDIRQVQEINRNLRLTRVPHSADAVRGVINLRGEVVTVVDLRAVLKLPPATVQRDSRNVIVNCGGDQVGLMVDRIADVVSASANDVEPRPENLGGVDCSFFTGVITLEHGLLMILDVEQTLAAVACEPAAHLATAQLERVGI